MKTIGLVIATLALIAMGGCASTTRIEARDSRIVLPSVKASLNFGKGTDTPSNPQDGHAVEFEALRAKGSAAQSLAPGQSSIVLDGKTFVAPEQLHHDFRFDYADISWRWRRFFGGGDLGLEVLAGVAVAEVEINTASPTLQASQGFHTRGAQGGVGLIWRAQPGTSLALRAREFASLLTGVGRAGLAEVSLTQALGRNVSVRLGYARWEVEGQELSNSSAFRLRFSGPSLQLQFDFGS